jgi:hypothetical protein
MPPSPIPAPLPPWARALLQIAPLIPPAFQFVLQHIGEIQDGNSSTNSSWRRLQLVFRNVADTEPADHMVTTMDIANITGGVLDNSWTDTDYTKVEGHVTTLVTAYMAMTASQAQWVESRYYVQSFSPLPPPGTPLSDDRPFNKAGAPERIFGHLVSGLPAGALQAHQVAITSTSKTAFPRHWGRNYWPLPDGGQLAGDGHWAAPIRTALAGALETFHQNMAVDEFFDVTTVTAIDKAPARGLLTTTEIQVDDVPDVVRRRRISTTTARTVLPVRHTLPA